MWSPEACLLLHLLWAFTVSTKVIPTARQIVTEPPGNLRDTNEATDSAPRQALWFDYPDTDKKKIATIYKLIGEDHEFVGPNLFPYYLRYILIGSVVLILLFFVYQIIVKLLSKRDS